MTEEMDAIVKRRLYYVWGLLEDFSDAYTKSIMNLHKENDKPFNNRIAEIEIQSYFAFLLISTLADKNHDANAVSELLAFCSFNCAYLKPSWPKGDDIQDVFDARVMEYLSIRDHFVESNDFSRYKASLRMHLHQNLIASMGAKELKTKRNYLVVGNIVNLFDYAIIDSHLADLFVRIVEMIASETTDVRSMTIERINAIIAECNNTNSKRQEEMAAPQTAVQKWWKIW